MLYSLVGTNTKVREKAHQYIAQCGSPTAHIYGEQLDMLPAFIDATSLFGEKIVVHLIQTLERAEGRERVYELLPSMQESQTLFFIDEPFADAHRVKKLEKVSEKLFDAREEKEKEVSPFTLTNAFARRDKKAAWISFMEIKDAVEPEALQGALWWKFQTVWADAQSGSGSKFTLPECEKLGKEILESSIKAHRGELDLKSELERIILSI